MGPLTDVDQGEIATINNCTSILTDPAGKYRLSGSEALQAFGQLSLYTTAEACPMVRFYSFLLKLAELDMPENYSAPAPW